VGIAPAQGAVDVWLHLFDLAEGFLVLGFALAEAGITIVLLVVGRLLRRPGG